MVLCPLLNLKYCLGDARLCCAPVCAVPLVRSCVWHCFSSVIAIYEKTSPPDGYLNGPSQILTPGGALRDPYAVLPQCDTHVCHCNVASLCNCVAGLEPNVVHDTTNDINNASITA